MDSPGTPQRSRKYRKSLLIVLGVLVFAVLGIHLWFINNAKDVLIDIVSARSRGKVQLELSHLRFNLFTNRLQVRQADLVSGDSTTSATTYRVRFRKLDLRVASFWPLLLKKQLLLDSINLVEPRIEVIQWRKDTADRTDRNQLSIPRQMGTLYNSMLDALEGFGIRRIRIHNASVSLVDKVHRSAAPVTITGIYFNLARSPELGGRRDAFVEDKQTIDLSTQYQNINLPGGRHRLSFKKFNLELFRRRIQLDSCTVTALATDSAQSSYTIFFNRLMLVGVDFDAMYHYNLIRADSVYCENPLFDINLKAAPPGEAKKGRPNPDQLIQELTGDLDLAFVGVKDAGIHIDIAGSKSRSLFNSNKDNFELRGLRINADSSQPVVVKRFDMLVQGYRLYNEDSSTAYSFDSIRFENNRIVLSKFQVTTETSRKMVHNFRDFRIPYFVLTGMDWYDLIFEQNLKAQEALLISPDIRYSKTKGATHGRKMNLYATLQSLDSLMTLDKFHVLNGRIDMDMGPSAAINLQNVDLSLLSNRLLQSRSDVGLRRAVERLSFSEGRIRFKDVTAHLHDVQYTGKNLLHAGRVEVSSRTGKVTAEARDVYLDNLLVDDRSGSLVVDGLRWAQANVQLKTIPGDRESKGSFTLRHIAADNTTLALTGKASSLHTYVQSLRLAALYKQGRAPVRTEGLALAGRNLQVQSGPMHLQAASYNLVSGAPSSISNLEVRRIQGNDSLLLAVPRIQFTADVNDLMNRELHLQSLVAQAPHLRLQREQVTPQKEGTPLSIRIDHLAASEPDIRITTRRDTTATTISLPHSDNSSLKASNLVVGKGGIEVGKLSANTTSATIVKTGGETMGVEKGTLELELSNVVLGRRDGKPYWGAEINRLSVEHPNALVLGRSGNRLMLEQATLGGLSLSSESLTSFDRLLKGNVSAWLRTATGQYIDSTTTLKWFNAGYNAESKTLSLDSFTYFPTQPLDTVLARATHQTDYITFRSGPIALTEFNLEDYKRDSALIAQTVSLERPEISIYRDKLPPFRSGVIKPLPVDMIKRIGLPLSLGNVVLRNGTLSYTERSAKTRAEGTIRLTNLNAELTNIKNQNHQQSDSLSLSLNTLLMDSAELNLQVRESYTDSLSGFLMTLRMKPTSLTFLNPVLAPLSSMIITSGTIDSLQLRAIGQEDLSLGEMNMFYRNLRVRLVKDGNPYQSSFTNRVGSFLANALVIRTNNNGRTGLVYFERLRDRSFFNYIVKMTFSGMATSIGVKSNKKYIRQYTRALKERSLPPIDLFPQ